MYVGKVGSRKTEISQFLQPYMEEQFQMSCQWFQGVMEYYGPEVWNELKTAIGTMLKKVELLQQCHKKGKIQYFIISFLRCSIYLDKLKWRIDALDEGFYLDEEECGGYYLPTFLQGRYWEDTDFLLEKARDHFIRLQYYEWMEIKEEYTELFVLFILQMMDSLKEYIMEEIEKSNISFSHSLKMICGEYMDRGTIFYEGKGV